MPEIAGEPVGFWHPDFWEDFWEENFWGEPPTGSDHVRLNGIYLADLVRIRINGGPALGGEMGASSIEGFVSEPEPPDVDLVAETWGKLQAWAVRVYWFLIQNA